jgi:hypothetical protein
MPLSPEQFRLLSPLLIGWIQRTLAEHACGARPVATLGFRRLPQYFSAELLTAAKVVAVERVPVPPLSSLGAPGFEAFETMPAAGITYIDTFFVDRRCAADESLHFHELIHIVQWKLLGPERFLAAYAAGLETHGYRDSPLEVMAYDAQGRFESDPVPFDAERLVAQSLRIYFPAA